MGIDKTEDKQGGEVRWGEDRGGAAILESKCGTVDKLG